MKKIVFEVTVEGRDAGDGSDRENEENIVDCIMYSIVFPESIKVTAKVLRREQGGCDEQKQNCF